MKPFETFQGVILPLDRANVDTDAIIPKQFLKSVERTGFGKSLFYDWRYLPGEKNNPEFILNRKEYQNAAILVARNNFGCGSSREHAVWAICQYGFRVVIAPGSGQGKSHIPGFADIFRNNSVKNGLLTLELSEAEVENIFQETHKNPGLEATVRLTDQTVTLHTPQEISFHFEIDPSVKERFLLGLDDIGITLKEEKTIREFETRHNTQLARA